VQIVNRVGIREDGGIWEFINEIALEDFLWDNLEALWGLIPLERQGSSEFMGISKSNEKDKLVI